MAPARWAELEAAFGELVDAADGVRAPRLAAIGAYDPELQATLAALLAADVAAGAHLGPVDARLARVSRLLLGAPEWAECSGDPCGMTGRMIAHFRVGAPLGIGGVGAVYRAEDTRLGRAVALKFLRPDRVADEATRMRFLREARSLAVLDHPNLCAIHEVGEDVDGTPFLAMALCDGEPLDRRLARERRLEIGDALAIAGQVAAGLACVHAAGIVHRDLKPANIMLLPDGKVKLVDFGLAKAPEDTVTHAGELLGTVAYMAPEQVGGERVDARADLWALGVILYEMLAGRRPFRGEHHVAIAHAITHDSPTVPSKLRRELPAAVERLVLELLEKEPSHRSTADRVAHDITRLPVHGQTRRVRRVRISVVALALTVVGAAFAVRLGALARVTSVGRELRALISRPAAPARLDERLIVVPPFRVAASDSSVRMLREGMMDLVSAKLTGSIRAIDARGVLREWRRAGGGDSADVDRVALVAMARRFGAGRVLDGSIVETAPGFLSLTGTLVDVGRPDHAVTVRVQGGTREIAALLDTVTATLLAMSYGEDEDASTALARTPFDALDAYLTGQFAFRAGHYLDAALAFRRAIEIDSTFALAAVRLDVAAAYSDVRLGAGALAIARAHRDRLGTVDRLLLDSYPTGFGLEHLAVQERAVQTAPDVPELWFDLGEDLAHAGPAMGFQDAQRRAIEAFERALEIDSAFTPARYHLIWCYSLLGDTSDARRVLRKLDPGGEQVLGARWLALGDRSALAAQLQDAPLHRLQPYRATAGMMLGLVDDLEWAARYMDSTSATRSDRAYGAGFTRWLALNRGQPSRARRATNGRLEIDEPRQPTGHNLEPVAFTPGAGILDVLLWGADPRDAAPGLALLDSSLRGPAPREWSEHQAWLIELFAGGEYGLRNARPTLARQAATRLRADARTAADTALVRCARSAALLLEAQLAAMAARPDAERLALDADSVLRRFDPGSEYLDAAGTLIMLPVWERLGELPRALAATRRVAPSILWPYYSAYLRERARLSVLAGQPDSAIDAYRRYVKLRAPAEASQLPDLLAARRALDVLTRSARAPR